MTLAADLQRFKAKAMGRADRIIRETVLEFGEQLVTDWTPLGNPELWKSPPPADYRPGNLQSSWFFSVGTPSTEKTDRTDIRAINGLDRLPQDAAGQTAYLANSADHASSIEAGHSSQNPVGILSVGQAEFSPMAYAVARRLSQ